MPVFDFNEKKKEEVQAERSYKLVYSSERTTSTQHPIMILEDSGSKLVHHSNGMFEAPTVGSAFIYDTEEKSSHNILEIDARFENLLKWLGENHISRLFIYRGFRDLCDRVMYILSRYWKCINFHRSIDCFNPHPNRWSWIYYSLNLRCYII